MILLLGVTILYAVLGSFKILPIEGFKDDVIGCSGEVVPECHDKLLSFANYKNDDMDDYILKTQIVVPTCPSGPSYSKSKSKSGSDKWDDSWENNKLDWKEKKKDWKKWKGSDWDKDGENEKDEEKDADKDKEEDEEKDADKEKEEDKEEDKDNGEDKEK